MAVLSACLNSVFFFVFLAVGVFQNCSTAACPPGWLAWQDACYILLPERMNWLEASEVCNRPGSSLFVPNSREEHDFIWQEMQVRMEGFGAQTPSDFELWIGCRKIGNTPGLACLDEVGNVFANWKMGEPNHRMFEECVRMAKKFGGKLGDVRCDEAKFVACEIHVPRDAYCLRAQADGRFTSSQCLLNHGIRNLTATGVLGCGRACWAEPRCHSFNLWQWADNQGKNCQLNNASSVDADVTDFIKAANCSFFEL